MKALFTADWHIKLGQKNIPKEWQKNRYRLLFSKLYELEKEVDVVIIGGDIFDKIPSLEELEIFFEYLIGTNKQIILYDGNHEATTKGKTFLHHLDNICPRLGDVIIIKKPANILGIDFIPYTHLHKFNPEDFSGNICCTHVRGNIPPHVIEEIDLNKFSKWKIVFAGDLHAHSNSQKNIVYPGSPFTTTFHRNKVKNGIVIFNTDKEEYDWVDLNLPQLIRKTVSSEKDIIKTEYDHTIYEVQGNILELSNIDTSSDLFDKKVINRNSKSKLELTKQMTIEEELTLYFKNILKIEDKDIKELLTTYYDYTT